MKKLYLASSFRTLLADKTLKKEFVNFLNKKPEDVIVGHIPNAADPKEDKSYVQVSVDQLKEMGMKIKEIDLRIENKATLRSKLGKCDVIFVNGGNTFYLLDIVRKSGFSEIIDDLLDQGKIYIAASAGSYIACPNIEMANWKRADSNIINLRDLTGLNLIPFLISAHYNREKYYEALVNGVHTTKLPVVALTDQQAIIVEDDKYKVIGGGDRNFFNGFKENY